MQRTLRGSAATFGFFVVRQLQEVVLCVDSREFELTRASAYTTRYFFVAAAMAIYPRMPDEIVSFRLS